MLISFGRAPESLALADEGLRYDYVDPSLHTSRADALIALKRFTEAKAAVASAEVAMRASEVRTERTCAEGPDSRKLCEIYQSSDAAMRSTLNSTRATLQAS